jgi:predicted RNA-binding protein with PIN domain
MPLHFVLDGYNIIKSDGTKAFDSMTLQAQRERLVGLINKNSPQGSRHNKVTVVFDGTYENSFMGNRSVSGAVEIIFSSGETADRKIEELVSESSSPAEIIVVTDDRGIWRLLGRSGAKIMGTKEFLKRLFVKPAKTANPAEIEDGPEDPCEINEELAKKWLK